MANKAPKLTTIQRIKIENMKSPRTGSPVPNQFIIDTDEGTYFQSYSTMIAANINGKIYLDKNAWSYSVTTSKYRNEFLGVDTKETKRRIKNGDYTLIDLN